MFHIDFDTLSGQLMQLSRKIDTLKPDPVFFYPYLKRVLTDQWETLQPKFPMDIKIPKENKYLLRGDFEPERIIHLDKPVTMDDGTPMWFASSINECFLRLGYENLDARFVSNIKFDMECIHGFLGGSSGQGKSVTLNAIVGALCYEYAPWELTIHLSDAKILEFKKYGIGEHIPHISTIAATEDADFIISVLGNAYKDMQERAKIFGLLGVSSLKSFRKKTGLTLSRVIIIMDEVESTFKLAGKKASKIANYIDGFARLGRSAGFHILMATQNVTSDIPSSAMGQVRLRLCLGANQKVSEGVLSNNGAQLNFGKVGRLIANTEVITGGNTFPSNIKFQTPFINDDEFADEMPFLHKKGLEVGYEHRLSFYDEEDVKLLPEFKAIVDKVFVRMKKAGEINTKQAAICLGFPAFVSDDTDNLLKIYLDQKDVENIVVCSIRAEHTLVMLEILAHSLVHNGYSILHYSSDVDMLEATPKAVAKEEAREADQIPLSGIGDLIRSRLFLLTLESVADAVTYKAADIEKLLEQDKVPVKYRGNSLVCKRAVAYYSLKKDPRYKSLWDPVANRFPTFLEVFDQYAKYNAIIDPLRKENLGRVVYFIGDLAKVVGWGRDSKSASVSKLKKSLQDASRANVLFVLYTRSLEGLNELQSGLRYGLFDSPDSKDWTRLRTEAPVELNKKLAVLFDMLAEEQQLKFKRTLIREEF